MLHNNVVEKIKTIFRFTIFFSKILPLKHTVHKQYSLAGISWRYGALALHAGYLTLPTHAQKCNT